MCCCYEYVSEVWWGHEPPLQLECNRTFTVALESYAYTHLRIDAANLAQRPIGRHTPGMSRDDDRPTQPPPTVSEWLTQYPEGSRLRTPEARALLVRLKLAVPDTETTCLSTPTSET